MDFEEYRRRGKEMVDYIADYLQSIRQRRVFPDVRPGYMRALVPESAPDKGEPWAAIFRDVERVIMPGITHWQSPHMHAYFPALNSFPSLLGDMLADAIGCLGFTWASSPACTELETITMDWLGKMIGLPSQFLHSSVQTLGGGVLQTTASDCTFVSLLAARAEMIRKVKEQSGLEDAEINARLISYCSDQAHSSVEKASLIGLVKLRFLQSDDRLSLRGETLREAIDKDREDGLIPFYLCATLGTTGACAYDNLRELGPICEEEGIWMHIDAAYAGSAFICPEFRMYMAGVEHAQSFAFNPSKWLMVHFDCSAMWLKNSGALHRTFNVDPLYLKHENSGAAIDYMHWQIALSRRFRSLKLWFVIRSFGVEGLQKHIRKGVQLAKMFEEFVMRDDRFEIPAVRTLGLVVFRLKGDNELTEQLLKRLNKIGRVHMVPASLKGRYIIRFTVTSQYTTPEDIERDWRLIQTTADQVIEDISKEEDILIQSVEGEEEEGEEEEEGKLSPGRRTSYDKDVTKNVPKLPKAILQRVPSLKKKDYGISLILSNVPMSPKVINGSFAALFENTDIAAILARHFESGDLSSRALRLSPRRRGKLRDQTKQLSLDNFFGSAKRVTGRFRQSSLDSKIDDILEVSSIDSDLPTNGRRGDSPEDLDLDISGLKVETEDIGEDLDELLKDGDENDAGTQLLNGVHRVCKHCGHSMDD